MTIFQPATPYSNAIIRPLCPKCSAKMLLSHIEPTDKPDHDRRTFQCHQCKHAVSEIRNALIARWGAAQAELSNKYEPVYCVLHGLPTIYLYGSGSLAWWYEDGAWAPAPYVEVACNAPAIDKVEFDAKFGELPPFPKAMLDQIAK